jgi:16S rRNA C1402 (ribose-2'-O) methylase RsmI
MYAMAELSERPILIHKELTKINEKLVVCLQKDIPNLDERGEHVIVVGPGQPQEKPIDEGLLHGLLASLRLQPGVTDEAAMALAASAFGRQPSEIRKLDKKRRYSVKQQNMDQP